MGWMDGRTASQGLCAAWSVLITRIYVIGGQEDNIPQTG
jgi:hypothetical protein